MKESFEKIKERLRAKKDNVAHNLQLFKDKKIRNMVSVCESKLDAYIDALSLVYEVEVEYINKSTEHINKLNDCSSGWIPCEKELPPEPEENPEFDGKKVELYLVSFVGTKYPWRAFWTGKNFTDGWSIVHPEAWMPLPESYRPIG